MDRIGYSTLSVIPEAKGFAAHLSRQIDPELAAAGRSGGGILGKALGIGAMAVAGVALAGIAAVIHTGIQETLDASAGQAQLAAGIKSTGNAAGVTVKGMEDLASSIQSYSGQTDDSIVKSEQLLLTFTSIRNVGVDKIFDQATIASADMAAKMGGDASQNAILLGKALNDPIKGISALTRVGVSFTEGQKASIKAMVESGDTMGAQKVILKELQTEFGGAAKAAGDSLPGQLQKLKRGFEDVSQSVVETILPLVLPPLKAVAEYLQRTVVPAVQSFLKEFRDGTGPGGQFKSMLENVGTALRSVFNFVGTVVMPVLQYFISTLAGTPTPILAVMGALVLLNTSMGTSLVSAVKGAITWLGNLATGMRASWGEAGRLATMQSAAGASAGVMATGTAFAAGALGTLGMALRGVLVSLGPIGIALGVAAAAAAIFSNRSDSGATSTATWTQALWDQNGALVANAKALAAAGIAKDETLAKAAQFGISTTDLTKGLMGNTKVLGNIKSQLQDIANTSLALDGRSTQQLEADAKRVDLAKSILASLNDTQGGLATSAAAAKRTAEALSALGVSVTPLPQKLHTTGAAAKDMATAFNDAASKSESRIQTWIENTKKTLADAKQQWMDYAKQVYSSITGGVNIGTAWTSMTDQQKAVVDAQKALADAQAAGGDSPTPGQSQSIVDAQKALADAQAAVKDFEGNLGSQLDQSQLFGDMFSKASDAITAQFGKDSPVWPMLRDQMLAAGPTQGAAMAQYIVEHGFTPEMATRLKDWNVWAGNVAKQQADNNFAHGKAMVDNVMKGLNKQIADEGKPLLTAGGHIGNGVVNGFKSKLQDFKDAIGEYVKALGEVWVIQSPSRVAHRMGAYVGEGFNLGLQSADVQGSIASVFAPPIASAGSLDFATPEQRAAVVNTTANDALIAEVRAMREGQQALAAEFRLQTDRQLAHARQGAR